MSDTLYVKPGDPAACALIRATFPVALNLKQAAVQVHDQGGISLTSYWSGGTRDYHAVVDLATMRTVDIPENGSGFTAVDRACGPAGLPLALPAPGYAVVTYTDGNYRAVRIHLHRDNAAKLLPAPAELTWAEHVVLAATRSLKASYGGIPNFRFKEAKSRTGITLTQWDTAKAALIARKLLDTRGAITLDGKNAIGTKDLYALGKEVA